MTTYPHFPLSFVLPLFTITQCPREQQQFLESLQLNENDATSLKKDTVSQRSSNRWWKERRPRITASQLGDILVRKSVTKPFLERLVNDCNPNSTNNLPEPLKHGIEHESAALQQYTNYMKHNGHPVKTFTSGFIVNPSYPFLGCSPDGKVIDETEDSPYGILEIKCPYKHRNVTPKQHALVIVKGLGHCFIYLLSISMLRYPNFRYIKFTHEMQILLTVDTWRLNL